MIRRLEANRTAGPSFEDQAVSSPETEPDDGPLPLVSISRSREPVAQPSRFNVSPARLMADPEGFSLDRRIPLESEAARPQFQTSEIGGQDPYVLGPSQSVGDSREFPQFGSQSMDPPQIDHGVGPVPTHFPSTPPAQIPTAFPMAQPDGLESVQLADADPFTGVPGSPKQTTAMSDMMLDGMAQSLAEASFKQLARLRDSVKTEFDLVQIGRGLF